MSIFYNTYIHPSQLMHFKAKHILGNARYRCEKCKSRDDVRVHYLKEWEVEYKKKMGKGLGIALCRECRAKRITEKPVIAPAVVSKLRKRNACITSPLTSGADRPLPEGVTDKRPALLVEDSGCSGADTP